MALSKVRIALGKLEGLFLGLDTHWGMRVSGVSREDLNFFQVKFEMEKGRRDIFKRQKI